MVSTPIVVISTKLAVHRYSHNLLTQHHQVNLAKGSQKILALLKPEKAALTELVQYYEEHKKDLVLNTQKHQKTVWKWV